MTLISLASIKPSVSYPNKVDEHDVQDSSSNLTGLFFSSLLNKKINSIAIPKIVKLSAYEIMARAVSINYKEGMFASIKGVLESGNTRKIAYDPYLIPRSSNFKEWLIRALNDDTFNLFLNFVQEDKDMIEIVKIMVNLAFDKDEVLALKLNSSSKNNDILTWLRNFSICDKEDFASTSPLNALSDLKDYTKILFDTIAKVSALRVPIYRRRMPDDIRAQGLKALYIDVVKDFEAYSHVYEKAVLAHAVVRLTPFAEAEQQIRQNCKHKAEALILSLSFPDTKSKNSMSVSQLPNDIVRYVIFPFLSKKEQAYVRHTCKSLSQLCYHIYSQRVRVNILNLNSVQPRVRRLIVHFPLPKSEHWQKIGYLFPNVQMLEISADYPLDQEGFHILDQIFKSLKKPLLHIYRKIYSDSWDNYYNLLKIYPKLWSYGSANYGHPSEN